MANKVFGAPAEVTKMATWTVASGGRLAHRLGANVVHRMQPNYVPPEVLKRQALLKRFEGRVAVVGHLIERNVSDRELDDRVSRTAYTMFDEGFVDEHAAVELRPILPEYTLLDPVLNDRRNEVVDRLKHTLASEYDVTAVPMSHPITPSKHGRSRVDAAITWGAIAVELDGLSHQISTDEYPRRRLAMLAITGSPYVQRFFGDHIVPVSEGNLTEQTKFLVLRRVGTLPQENVLVPARQTKE